MLRVCQRVDGANASDVGGGRKAAIGVSSVEVYLEGGIT